MDKTKDQPADEFSGQGGSYVVGADGVKRLTHRTAPPEAAATDQSTEGQQAVKEPAATATDKSASAKPKK